MAKTTSTEVVEAQTSAVALPADLMAELAREAQDAAASERPKVSKMSLRSGMMKIGDQMMPGNQIEAVILFAAHIRTWYAGAFNGDNIKNPDCFALTETDEEDETPHANAANPQAENCASCPKNAWKSDVKQDGSVGKGKACKERRRLIVLPAGALETVDKVKSAELCIIDLPVTSAKNYGGFVNAVAATASVPPWAVVANIKSQPHPRNQFEVIITPLRVPQEADIIYALRERVKEARRIGMTPFDETSPENAAVSEAQRARQAKVDSKLG